MAKRDNDYFARRLQRDHPQVWHDFQAGVYKSLAEARRAAGLAVERTRVHELKNAWHKATAEQRDEFLVFLDAEGVTLPLPGPKSASTPTTTAITGISAPATATGTGFTVAQNGYLTQQAKDRINQIIDIRRLRGRYGAPKIGIIMKEFGTPFSPNDASLGSALRSHIRLRADMIKAVEHWLVKHAGM